MENKCQNCDHWLHIVSQCNIQGKKPCEPINTKIEGKDKESVKSNKVGR